MAPPANEQARTPPPRLSISGDSIPVQAIELSLGGTAAPQIEALEPECWGVIWGAGAYENPKALVIKGNTGEEMELARGIEPPTG